MHAAIASGRVSMHGLGEEIGNVIEKELGGRPQPIQLHDIPHSCWVKTSQHGLPQGKQLCSGKQPLTYVCSVKKPNRLIDSRSKLCCNCAWVCLWDLGKRGGTVYLSLWEGILAIVCKHLPRKRSLSLFAIIWMHGHLVLPPLFTHYQATTQGFSYYRGS